MIWSTIGYILWAVLRARGLAPKLVDLIQNLYADNNASVGLKASSPDHFPSYQG